MSKIKSMFLGPNAENLELFQKLVDDIILDAAFLRRNYQPDDVPIISEHDKTDDDYISASAEVQQSLKSVLSDLKKSVPTYHPRHIGHMNADVFMSGIAGFFGAMMYNPNNIINVASPTTTDMEVEYINRLCQMVGYQNITTKNADNGSGAWGHVCSGGTSANIEALWVLRNLKYFPLTLKLVASTHPFIGDLTIGSLQGKRVKECQYKQLFNISVDDIYDLISRVPIAISDHLKAEKALEGDMLRNAVASFYENEIKESTVQKLGVVGIHEKIRDEEGKLGLPIVCISRTHHYSWEKAMDIIGLGNKQLQLIDVNHDFQLDIHKLETELNSGSPILAVVGIMGTTEEGAFDPLHEIINLKAQHNNSFFVHVDGAYGGYFASFPKDGSDLNTFINKVYAEEMIPKAKKNDEEEAVFAEALPMLMEQHFNFDSEWQDKVNALSQVDSITIDPHKLGYIPYPAGAILFKDYRSRQTISFDAPYVSNEESQKSTEIYLGNWTMEGSRPGAAAVACCLSGRVLPLDARNHGSLLACTVISAARLFHAIEKFNNSRHDGFRILPLFKTDSNCVCYIVINREFVSSPLLLNHFTKAVVDELTINPKTKIIPDYDFIISQSQWKYADYGENIRKFMEEAGIDESRFCEMEGNSLQYIRSVMMNPLAAYESATFYDQYFDLIGQIANKALVKAFSEVIFEHNGHKRFRIAWIENDAQMEGQANHILIDPQFGYALDIDFFDYGTRQDSLVNEHLLNDYDAIIVDLNLTDNNHKTIQTQNSKKLIKAIKKLDAQKRVFVCSEYLSHENPNQDMVVADLLDPANHLMLTKECFIPKCRINGSFDLEGNKLRVIQTIFNSLQQQTQ